MCVGGKGDSIWRDVDGKEFGGGCFLLIIILRGAKTSARFMTRSALARRG